MFDFLKKRIDVEEKKKHSDSVDIILVAHGAIRDSMIPASCLLPGPSVTDVLLYSPWNCTMNVAAVFGVATGHMKPQHRVFSCSMGNGCKVRDDEHRPTKLPNCWNSMKKAGDQMIPNISLSPLKPREEGVWDSYQTLCKKYGPPERNRIVIPFILLPGSDTHSIPFFVVSLALLLVLSSRFQAACLGDQSAGPKFDRDYLKSQYACAKDNTVMTSSADMFATNWRDVFRRWFG